MADTKRKPASAAANLFGQIVVGIYIIVDAVLGPIFRPFMRWLSNRRLIQKIEAGIAALPAYAVLALLAAPFAVEEVIKVYGIYLMGSGHFKWGLVFYIAAHVFAILVCERIFRAGKEKLLTIPWFERGFRWLESYKDRMVSWFRSTDAYKRMTAIKEQIREAARRAFGKTKTAIGR